VPVNGGVPGDTDWITMLVLVSPQWYTRTMDGELNAHDKLAYRAEVNIGCERCSKHACDRNIVVRDVM
jgi:hypothetical protein